MNNHHWSLPLGISLLLLGPLILGCQPEKGIRGVEVRHRATQSSTYDIIDLVTSDQSGESVRFWVSGTGLKWSFDDLNGDGKEDVTFTSEIHKTYFAKFLIQDGEPRIQLLGNQGITVMEPNKAK